MHSRLYELMFIDFWIGFYRVELCILMDRKTFKAICADCGEECDIPFEPTEGRPVKCNDCFRRGRGGSGGRDRGRRRDFNVVCAECGKATTVPFKPVQGNPVPCRNCFDKSKKAA